jgi:hypothetical protein
MSAFALTREARLFAASRTMKPLVRDGTQERLLAMRDFLLKKGGTR